MRGVLSTDYKRWLWGALLLVIAIRLLTLGAYSLQDTTEARYAEIARIMFETQNWVTPQFDYGIPFWGKPPLATWLSAGSFQLFGVSEFTARLPSLVLSLFLLISVYLLAKHQRHTDYALISIYILISSILFFITAGAVLMDTALVMGITLSMVSFWLLMNNASRLWGYLFFIGLSIGLLSKGPLTLVLVGTPICLWMVWQRNFKPVFQAIPWFTGTLLMLALTLPWYVLAELRTPGFIDYFIVGEHWNRFIVTGWQGDLYGSAHAKPRGTILIYALISFFPWFFLLPVLFIGKTEKVKKVILQDKSWLVYLSLWALVPILFFAFAGNILATYALPVMIPLALLLAELFVAGFAVNGGTETRYKPPSNKAFKVLFSFGLMTPLLLLIAISLQSHGYIKTKSQKDLMKVYSKIEKSADSHLLYLVKRPFSAQFYSQGKALEINDWDKLNTYFNDNKADYVVIKKSKLKTVPDDVIKQLYAIDTIHDYTLYGEKRFQTQ